MESITHQNPITMQGSLSSPTSQQHLLDNKKEGELIPIPNTKKLGFLSLLFLIYFEVAGGPYGVEYVVKGGGPLFTILGFLIFPFMWSIPMALVTAELSTAFPSNGGYVIWATKAFGPFWGFLIGFWKFFSMVMAMASVQVACVDYLKSVIPTLSYGLPRYLFLFISTSMLSFLNYSSLTITGYATVALAVVSLTPFVLMSLISIPKIDPIRWLSLGEKGVKKDWTLYINNLLVNFSYWDNVSTLAGEIEHPQKTFPKALLSSVLLTCLSNIIPFLAAIGAIPLDQGNWVDGYFARVAEIIAGKWLKYSIEIGDVLSTIGQFEALLSSAAYQVMGMADLGFIPRIFGARSRWFNTPWMGILMSTVIVFAMSSYLTFTNIVSMVSLLYSLGMVLEFASYLELRRKYPALERPFEVPMRLPGLLIMCFMPSLLLVYVFATASKIVYIASAFLTALGVGFYFFMIFCKFKKWVEFNRVGCELDHNS